MAKISRIVSDRVKYGSRDLLGVEATEIGDVEVIISEIVTAGATVVFPISITAAALQAMAASCVPATASLTFDSTDVLLPVGGSGVMSYAQSSGASTPLPAGNTTTISVDNSGGGEDVEIFIGALSETP